jgi:molybdopterin-biosynthesis enzyme MoeA-like protein
MKFFALIIGTEILNLRRQDSHFDFLSKQLKQRGWEFWGCNIIKDDPKLITESIAQIANMDNSVLFCFGGIGATPDDYTRECAAKALSDGKLYMHEEAKSRIIAQFGDAAYPHRVNMASLPKEAKLLDNPVNNVAGFQLHDRFFFTPGFPQMAHPMIIDALDRYYKKNKAQYRLSLMAQTSENTLIEVMKEVPNDVEFSSLPKFVGLKRSVAISVAGYDKEKVHEIFAKFETFIRANGIEYEVGNF